MSRRLLGDWAGEEQQLRGARQRVSEYSHGIGQVCLVVWLIQGKAACVCVLCMCIYMNVYTCMHAYVWMYMYVCVCICVIYLMI